MLQPRSFYRAGMLLVMLSACAFAFAPPQESAAQKSEARRRLISTSAEALAATATTRVEPVEPPVARLAVHAGVSVRVLINEQGEVIDASAVAGHPVLKNA